MERDRVYSILGTCTVNYCGSCGEESKHWNRIATWAATDWVWQLGNKQRSLFSMFYGNKGQLQWNIIQDPQDKEWTKAFGKQKLHIWMQKHQREQKSKHQTRLWKTCKHYVSPRSSQQGQIKIPIPQRDFHLHEMPFHLGLQIEHWRKFCALFYLSISLIPFVRKHPRSWSWNCFLRFFRVNNQRTQIRDKKSIMM